MPEAFKEAAGWVQATPADEAPRQDWWRVFGDPMLDELEAKVAVSNQTLAADEAAYRNARALLDQQRAALLPTVNLTGNATQSQSPSGFIGSGGSLAPSARPTNIYATAFQLNWDVDLWGRIRRQIEAAHANAQASAGDLANATLSAQALLASSYFQLREADEEKRVLDQTVKGYADNLRILQAQTKAGTGPLSAELQAQSLLKTTQAQSEDLARARAILEHAIAVQLGEAPADFTLQPAAWKPSVPTAPVSIPATLLQRRPDIAAAERRMKSANAQIGVTEAGYFPDVQVNGNYGFTSTLLNQLVRAHNNSWSIGASAAEALFNAGATGAKVRQARAGYDSAVANYRETVLTAFQQVEDNIVAVRALQSEYELDQAASEEADRVEDLINKQYQVGTIDYTTVIVNQNAALSARRATLQAARSRLVAAVNLVQALGGGWSSTQLAQK
jgi:NodT family efflux transporter outer membrane factor (OMF) lipoprotein